MAKPVRYFYYDPRILDLAKMRKEAEDRAKGDYYADPAPSEIHFHKFGEECNDRCEDYPTQESVQRKEPGLH